MSDLIFADKKQQRIYDVLFVVLIAALTAYKFNDFFLPYFWDELGVYSQAAVYQYYHGISLMPASLPDVLSRGHPLLFTFLNACAFKIFGCSVLTGHIFNFCISVLLLLFVYKKIASHVDQLTAIATVTILSVQPIFLAQSALMIPEMLLALLAVCSVVSYYEKRYFMFALFASLAILTKESAVVLPCVALFYAVVRYWLVRDNGQAFKPVNLLLVFLPYVFFGVFLVIQKAQNGWYFFPYHMENVSFSLDKTTVALNRFITFIFLRQGRNCWILLWLAAGIINLAGNKINRSAAGKSIVTPLFILGLALVSFSALSFYMERYVLIVFIPLSFLTAFAVTSISRNRFFITAALCTFAYVASINLEAWTFNYDADMGYRHEVRALKQAVDYTVQVAGGKYNTDGDFPAYFALRFREGGYLDKGQQLITDEKTDTSYFVQCITGPPFGRDSRGANFRLVKQFEERNTRIEIYQVKSNK